MVRGTFAAVVPIEVPATSRVKGMIATTRMMNGVERAAFTIRPSVVFRTGAESNSPRREVARKMPKGAPISVPSSVDMATM